MAYPGSLEKLVSHWSRFPGIGEKTARRLVFYLMSAPREWVTEFADCMRELREKVHPCPECGNITDQEVCFVCSDLGRDQKTLCVMETAEDCAAMEQAGIYFGLYHVLGGRLSPLDDEEIPEKSLEALKSRIDALGVQEVVLATNPRIEGDLTAYAIQEALAPFTELKITRLAYGLPVGGSIGFADRVTLHVALESRKEMRPFD